MTVISHSLWDDRHSVAWPCLPHLWHRLFGHLLVSSSLPFVDTHNAALCLDSLSTFFLRMDRRCGLARSPSSFPVTVSLWLDASAIFSNVPFGMIDTVWLVLGTGSLPFRCRLLLVFVDTVFMRLGALTVSLQFVGSVDCMAWPCLPHPWPLLFCHLALVGSRLFQSFAFLSYLVRCWGAPGDAQVVSCLPLAPVSLLFPLFAKSGFPSIPFLARS